MWRKRLKWTFFGWAAGIVGVGGLLVALGVTGPLEYLLAFGTWIGVGYEGYKRETA